MRRIIEAFDSLPEKTRTMYFWGSVAMSFIIAVVVLAVSLAGVTEEFQDTKPDSDEVSSLPSLGDSARGLVADFKKFMKSFEK